MQLNLERTKITSGLQPILESLKKTIIAYGEEELKKDTAKIIDTKVKILKYGYINKYLKNIPLFFNRNGFGVYSTKALKSLQEEGRIKGITEVYGMSARCSVNIGDLKEDKIYVFYNEAVDNTKASDFIEEEDGTRYLSPDVIKNYFVNGMDSYFKADRTV